MVPPDPGEASTVTSRFQSIFHIRCDAAVVEARARGIAVEHSVECPIAAIDDPRILADIVGQVAEITDLGGGVFEARIALAAETVGGDAGQFLNMALGNTSLHDDITLQDMVLTPELETALGGPGHGLAGLRRRVGAEDRALTCSAIKPQGLAPARLADLVARFAAGGVDFVKDDHSLVDQAYAPFAERVPLCAAAIRGSATRYVPNLSGSLDTMREQLHIARDAGLDTAMVAPMLIGPANLQALVRDNPDFAFFGHPTMGGGRIAPALLFGTLYRLWGADAVIFVNYGGRFGYAPQTSRAIAERARAPNPRLKPAVPTPAGGMLLSRVPELLDFYGPDTMLLIGGDLLLAHEQLAEETAAFTQAVARHSFPVLV